MSETRKIDVIIPTYHPDEKLEKCLRMLKRQTVQPQRILLINTEEEFFHSKVFSTLKQGEIIHITKPEFDHGGTRNQAAAMCDTYYTGLRINCKDSRITAVIWSPFLHGLNNATVPVQKYSGYK